MMPQLADYSYTLPEELIAQNPAKPRDHSRLLVVDRSTEKITHCHFFDIESFLGPNDVLVLNNSKVFPARLKGIKDSGSKVEVLLLRFESETHWWALSHPGLKVGQKISFSKGDISIWASVIDRSAETGQVLLAFQTDSLEMQSILTYLGEVPTPPYIHAITSSKEVLKKEYQTVFAKEEGSAAAPTAGLHFTNNLLTRLKNKGVQIEYVTLHVGPGTFQRLWQENIVEDKLHTEWYQIESAVAQRLITAKKRGKRIIAVGTTSTRTLESAYYEYEVGGYDFKSGWQDTQLFIHPPYKFSFVDALITNFHVPESSLLMLVGAFTSSPQTNRAFKKFSDSLVGKAYSSAILKKYRFYSFGDAMFIQ